MTASTWALPEGIPEQSRTDITNMIAAMEAAGVAAQLICLAINQALALLPGVPQIACGGAEE